MKEGQTAIYALTGPSRSHLENSPYLEAFKARGYEVAFFTDHGTNSCWTPCPAWTASPSR